MGELVFPIAFGLTAVTLTALSAGLGWALRQANERTQRAEALLITSAEHVDALSGEADTLQAEIVRLAQELKQADKSHGLAAQDWETERGTLTETLATLKGDLDRTQEKLDVSKRECSAIARSDRTRQRILKSLGLRLTQPRNPTGPRERIGSRSVVRQLLVSSGSEAAALVASSGLMIFAAGRTAAMERLGAAAALAGSIEPSIAAVLCAPVAGVTLAGPRFAQHLLRIQGSDRYVGVENMGEAPQFALRHARLSLAGRPAAPTTSPEMPEHYIDLDETTDKSLQPILSEWAARWSAQSVTVIGPDGRPLAATASAEPGAAMGLRQSLRAVTLRAVRDRVPLDSIAITAWAEDGTTAQVAFVHADLDTAAIISLAEAPLPERALTELQSTVRWHLSATAQHTREAS